MDFYFILLFSENMFGMILIFWSYWNDLWLNMWSILQYFSHKDEKNVYSIFVAWVLYRRLLSISSSCLYLSPVEFKSRISCSFSALVICLTLSVCYWSPPEFLCGCANISVGLEIPCFMNLGATMLGVYILSIVKSSCWVEIFIIM